MSIVRYVNSKTGKVSLYESTSYYDPIAKQSRPKRKYLGTEDPETGELIPSSGKRGRRKGTGAGSPTKKAKDCSGYREKYEMLKLELSDKDTMIKQLEHENRRLRFGVQKLRDAAAAMVSGKDTAGEQGDVLQRGPF